MFPNLSMTYCVIHRTTRDLNSSYSRRNDKWHQFCQITWWVWTWNKQVFRMREKPEGVAGDFSSVFQERKINRQRFNKKKKRFIIKESYEKEVWLIPRFASFLIGSLIGHRNKNVRSYFCWPFKVGMDIRVRLKNYDYLAKEKETGEWQLGKVEKSLGTRSLFVSVRNILQAK